jgi:HlyD family secretion protein
MGKIWKLASKYKTWIILFMVISVAAKTITVLYANTPTKNAEVSMTVERGDITATVAATGTINPVNMVDVSSKISGLIKEVNVAENNQVKEGQILLLLDDTHLQAQVAQARSKFSDAANKYERSKKLAGIGAISDQELDTTQTAYNVARAVYDDALSQLNDTVIRAPIDGMVIGKPLPAGQAVAPGFSEPMVLLTIADMSRIQIQVQIDESDIGKVQVGQKVAFSVDAYPGRMFSGVVSNVSQKATIQQNVVYYNVLVDVDNPGGVLRQAMTARVSINIGESKNCIVVPLSIVKTANGQQFVAALKDGQMIHVPITTGLINDEKAEVLSGLEEGDQVLAPPQAKNKEAGNKGAASSMNLFRGMGAK